MVTKPKRSALQVIKQLLVATMGLAVLAVVAGLGLLMVLAGVQGVSRPTHRYLPATGTVVDHRASIDRGAPDTASRNRYSLRISVRYTYAVDGTTYPGLASLRPIDAGSRSEAENLAAGAARRYARGAPIELYYDPHEPSQNALERRSRLAGTPVLVFGVILLGGALGLAVMALLETARKVRHGPHSEPSKAERVLWRRLKRAAVALTSALFVAALVAGALNYPYQVAIVVGLCGVTAAIMALRIRKDRQRARQG